MAAALLIRASFSHLAFFYAYLTFTARRGGGAEAPRVPSPGARSEECNFSAPLLTGLLLPEIMEEHRGGTGVSLICFLPVLWSK